MIKKIIKSTALPIILLTVNVLSAILFRATRASNVFINLTLGFEHFSIIILILMAVTAIFLGGLACSKVYKTDFCNKKAYNILLAIGLVFSVIFLIFALVYSAGLFFGENNQIFTLNLKKTLSEGAALVIIPFLVMFFPALSNKAKKATGAVILAVTLIAGANILFPLKPFKITSEPLVIDNGKEYSIVFSTNAYASAYAEYTYEGKEYKVYDNVGGRLGSEKRIHSIAVPYEHLKGNTYKVSATRVIEDYSYGSRLGKTVTSDEYTFTCNEAKDQKWLVISDWHTFLDKAYKAIENLESDYDAVILLGDATPGVDFEEQAITNIVEFGGKVSGGTKPVLYARGNHETRGPFADELPQMLGLEQLYYTADFGQYSFVVLDSGEDKDDSHPEYGGMTDYNTYRADMIEWLKGVEVKNDKVINLCHAWNISEVEEELCDAGWAELDRLGTRLQISGHAHKCRFLGDGEGKEKEIFTKYPDIVGYIDGGKVGDNYIASLLTLSDDGFVIKAVDMNGEKVFYESFKW